MFSRFRPYQIEAQPFALKYPSHDMIKAHKHWARELQEQAVVLPWPAGLQFQGSNPLHKLQVALSGLGKRLKQMKLCDATLAAPFQD